MADKLNLRVQPVVITGSKWLLNEHNRTAHNATIKVIYLPAFNAKDASKEWYQEVKDTMQATIDEEEEKYGRER